MNKNILIMGLGNTLLSDEGAGVHAVQRLNDSSEELHDVEFLDGGTLSFTLAPAVESSQYLIVIDATELHAPAGTVRHFVNEEMDHFLGSNRKCSVHEVALIDLLAMAHLQGSLPKQRALIGIQPEYIDWGEKPTAAVMRAIPHACDVARTLIRAWRQ